MPIRAPRGLPAPFHRFARDAKGSVTVESVFFLPILIWVVLLTFVLYDVFRNENTNAKAAYAVADVLSRQVQPVDAAYLDGLGQVYARLARARHPTFLRTSSVDFDVDANAYRLRWSYGTNGAEPLTAERLQQIAHRLPVLSPGETVILVETMLDYEPPLDFGIGQRRLSHIIPTRPRFAPRLLFNDAGVG